jgi:membrane-bound lytic murein transglycosylase B
MNVVKCNFSLKTLVVAVINIALWSLCADAWATCLYTDFEGWKDCFVKDKLSTQLAAIDLEVFRAAKFVPKVIELDRKQPEHKMTLSGYIKLINLDRKIVEGKKFLHRHAGVAKAIGEQYGVEPEIIVALIGMESDYGLVQGRFNVVDALATLSYEGRRKKFFEGELLKLLTVARNEGLRYDDLKGSWAGAMGQTQFMPSSYLAYAVDYDEDGKADIWSSVPDAMASAANYLKNNGWTLGKSQIKQLKNPKMPNGCKVSEKKCPLTTGQDLRFIDDGGTMKTFLVGGNFDVLMKWNRSTYFGIGVLTIASGIVQHQ